MATRAATRILQKRFYGGAAPSAKSAPKPVAQSEVQVGRASNGVNVAAQENNSPLARVVCAVKAGSRYELPDQRGVAHFLRAASDLTQKENRAFGMTRDIQQMGGNISCTSSREHLIYTLEVPKDLLGCALPYLTGMVAQQSFRPWEIGDALPRLEYEILALADQPDKRVVEKLHEVAYRENGLGRSLYAPLFQLSQFSNDSLTEYVTKNFTPDRVVLSGTGISLNQLLSAASKFDQGQQQKSSDSAAKFFGGEVRENSEDLLAYTVIAGEGASLRSEELWAFAVLEQLLGSGPQIKWASNMASNTINAAVAKKTSEPYSVHAFNVNYSDSGLFGFSAVTVPENSEVVLRTVVEQLRSFASAPPKQEAIQGAKNRVKSTVAFQSECLGDLVQARAVELLTSNKISQVNDTLKAIDAISAAAVQNAAKKVVGGRLSMASVGEVYNVPYLDQL